MRLYDVARTKMTSHIRVVHMLFLNTYVILFL